VTRLDDLSIFKSRNFETGKDKLQMVIANPRAQGGRFVEVGWLDLKSLLDRGPVGFAETVATVMLVSAEPGDTGYADWKALTGKVYREEDALALFNRELPWMALGMTYPAAWWFVRLRELGDLQEGLQRKQGGDNGGGNGNRNDWRRWEADAPHRPYLLYEYPLWRAVMEEWFNSGKPLTQLGVLGPGLWLLVHYLDGWRGCELDPDGGRGLPNSPFNLSPAELDLAMAMLAWAEWKRAKGTMEHSTDGNLGAELPHRRKHLLPGLQGRSGGDLALFDNSTIALWEVAFQYGKPENTLVKRVGRFVGVLGHKGDYPLSLSKDSLPNLAHMLAAGAVYYHLIFGPDRGAAIGPSAALRILGVTPEKMFLPRGRNLHLLALPANLPGQPRVKKPWGDNPAGANLSALFNKMMHAKYGISSYGVRGQAEKLAREYQRVLQHELKRRGFGGE